MTQMARSSPLQRSTSASRTFDIPDLIALATSGKLRVPNFQRSFVWDASDVRKLFDSIYRGFPIGTLLLWQREQGAETVRIGPIKIDAPADSSALVVVDGQQRITSLIGSLAPTNEPKDERFEVFFDLGKRRFVGLTRGARPLRAIPVREAVESRRLLAWLRNHDSELEPDDLETADEFGGALRDYRVPAYVVESQNETLLREVFDRVNSAGKPVSRAQTFHALFANETEPGSPGTVVEALRNNSKFGSIGENRVVQSLLAIRGGDVARDFREEFSDDEDPADWYEQTERALESALTFIGNEGVSNQWLMPSSFALPVLAAFFHLHPEPTEWNRQLLSRWIWRGWVHGFGKEGGQTPALRRAVRSINPKKRQPQYAPPEYEAVSLLLSSVRDSEFSDDIKDERFRTDNARSRLALLALSTLHPRSPDGQELDIAELLNLIGAPQVIGELVEGHRSSLGARAFWMPFYPALTGREDPIILRSHAVSERSAQRLMSGDTSGFIEIRGRDIAVLTRDFLNSKMAINSILRPPLEDLTIPDPEEEEV